MERESAAENILAANRLSVNMLIEDADIGLALLKVAQTTVQHRSRRVGEAHKAYKSILSSLDRLSPDATQMQTLANRIKALAEALKAAGVQVD